MGSNYMTWWQQVAHFSDRFACVTFSHRGYTPGSDVGIPDPNEFAGDLAALIEHLELPDVRLVAQSMGGLTSMEYILSHPQHNVQALVLTSTSGSIHRPSVPLPDLQRLEEWEREAAAAGIEMQRRGVSPPAGERIEREQPELHFLYRQIANASVKFDREALRKRTNAMRIRSPDVLRGFSMPTLFVTGEEDTTFPPFLAEALAPLMPDAKVERVTDAGHSVYFERASTFNRLLDLFFAGVR
jgi:pimeloyl-ACP methyl ester carboxylesterase